MISSRVGRSRHREWSYAQQHYLRRAPLTSAEVTAWVKGSMVAMLNEQQLLSWHMPMGAAHNADPDSSVVGLVLSNSADDRTLLIASTVSKLWQLAVAEPQFGLRQRSAALRSACEARRQFHPPFFVDLVDGSDAGPVGPGSGTQQRPMATVARAEELYHEFMRRGHIASAWHETEGQPHIKVACQLGLCPLLRCRAADCIKMICKEHGEMGSAYVHEDTLDAYFKNVTVCAEEGCDVAYCQEHAFRPWHAPPLSECKVCHDHGYAARAVGATNEPGEATLLCRQHARRCQRVLENSYDEDENEEPDICGWVCCANCIDDHECGNDVTEYL